MPQLTADEPARPRGAGFKLSLLSTLVALAALVPSGPAGADPCNPDGTNSYLCTGDLSQGLVLGNIVPQSTTKVTITDLTSNIDGGVHWGLGGFTGTPATRTLDIDTGSFSFQSPNPINFNSVGFGNSPNAAPLTLNFKGTIENPTSGSGIFVANLATGSQLNNAGGTVGDINLTLDGSLTGPGNVRISSFAGNGGIGGSGANSGDMTLNTAGSGFSISTTGNGLSGILGGARGGPGGAGKNDSTGGNGGNGGKGGAFLFGTTQADWTISTTGDFANGLYLYSVGGNGGNGGNGSSGKGGKGGNGGAASQIVGANLNMTISTKGDNAIGIVSSSIGGDGGNGGSGGFFGGGGDGGAGGYGLPAQIIGRVSISTEGVNSSAIALSSIGGTGGRGGNGGFFGGGGNGAGSGNSGGVTIDLSSDSVISTKGENSVGIAMQSIGGRGGNGGGNAGLFNFSASGGSAGKSGEISIISAASISTEGNASDGILAQSIGGGGGQGGSGFGLFYSSGGSGSIGGPGGDIVIGNDGSITTAGNVAPGIQAQSISGSGGNGGSSAGAFSMGGGSAKSADSGNVTIYNTGLIETGTGPAGDGDAEVMACEVGCSYGIVAQSIGGGGGNGGSSGGWFSVGGGAGGGGNAGSVSVDSNGSIFTHLTDSTAILAQSIGGGGGNGGAAVGVGVLGSVAVGGSGGEGGSAGKVTVVLEEGADTRTFGDGSHAIQAQSLGGGGGNGAFSVAAAAGITFPGVAVSIGGSGGKGGNGSAVEITASGSGLVRTAGDQSHGLFAQSIGGGGGNGGFAISLAASNAGAISFGIGGSGGNGGTGAAAGIANSHRVTTAGDSASPLIAQSIGGGGGNGGLSITGSVAITSPGVSVSLGGTAGSGNTASTASIDNSGSLTSAGDESAAIVAQSIGGGGGNGGLALAAALTTSGSGAVSFALGGGGGTGGNAGQSHVDNSGAISTGGTRAPGILAQSIGGGGGNGGTTISANLTTGQSVGLGGSIGGSGGVGGNGAGTRVTNSGAIVTKGERSEGILAQSIGGGGGNGGFSATANLSFGNSNSVAFSVGGRGGAAGRAGLVQVITEGDISTSGEQSRGILAQSIGGGGGNGGSTVAGAITSGSSNTLAASIGGSGQGSGDGNAVLLGANADIVTAGTFADGILAQSIGGSGGNGGTSVSGTISSSTSSTQVGIGIGGASGNAGNGNEVTINPSSVWDGEQHDITVTGEGSRGIVAQSIGGGGGNAGMVVTGNFVSGTESRDLRLAIGLIGGAGGNGNTVSVFHDGSIATGSTTPGDSGDIGGEHAILAQSISGGGGDGSVVTTASNNRGKRSVFLGIGGKGGSGAEGGTVDVTKAGAISTSGNQSHGILAQSIGGGGGNGGITTTYSLGGDDSQNFGVTVGGSGGTGNKGGAVSITNSASVSVSGLGSQGLVAQSIGGGGGNGAANQFPGLTSDGDETTASTFLVSVGGFGGSGGGGDAVTITNSGAITTGSSGLGADDSPANIGFGHAVVAQSISSGGGSGGIALEGDLGTPSGNGIGITVGGGGAGTAAAGTVTVSNQAGGSLHTLNDESHGILAQSIGGGGGNGASGIKGDVTNGSDKGLFLGLGGSGGGGGDGEKVLVTSKADIQVEGDRSKGILAQSIGGGGGNGDIGIEGGLEGDSDDQSQLAIAIGGSGGSGGSGGIVSVTVGGSITTGTTAGSSASSLGGNDAILAQSIGGGGGDGGAGIAGDITSSEGQSALNLGLGGGGGGSRGGGQVQVVTQRGGSIEVSGNASRGIVAQSIGGAGGNGGAGIDGSIKAGENASGGTQLNLGIGRESGPGGQGGDVTVANTLPITTNASGLSGVEGNHAIFAQSIAGGGGSGGIGVTGDIENASESKAATIGIGGVGTNASDGGAVFVTNEAYANLQVSGAESVGIFAQSVGGGGGSGGIGIGGSITTPDDAKEATQLEFGLGGAAGGGGDGGIVTVLNIADITALADPDGGSAEMHGIFAQSIGGGGGQGALGVQGDIEGSEDGKALALAIGGSGGSGGDGAAGTLSNTPQQAGVGIINYYSITTVGDGSKGIFAQNIGGGGGNGSAGLEGKIESGDGQTITLAVGASGGGGGKGGTIWIQNLGSVTTGTAASTSDASISEAHGVFAQSIGGGGGSGSLTGSLTFAEDGKTRGLAMDLGAAASGGDGGAVVLDNGTIEDQQIFANAITTYNTNSHGLFAQSVGGGGGTLGSIGGVESESDDTLWGLSLTLGGSGGAAGNGGAVTLRQRGQSITTYGAGSYGLFAQSVGGGGGEGGDAASPTASKLADFDIALGGRDASSGDGGAVAINLLGTEGITQQTSTSGRAAVGVFAQSIGGGGGKGGTGAGSNRTITLGGSGGAKGNGGSASVYLTNSALSTRGVQSPGVVVQSVGGGGGYAGQVLYRSTASFGSGLDMGAGTDTSGNGGLAEVFAYASTVSTRGANAPGLFVQSVGGGGGVDGKKATRSSGALIGSGGGSGTAGPVTVTVGEFSEVATSGKQSHGVFAQSAGGSGGTTDSGVKVNVAVNGEVSATGPGSHGVYAQSSGAGRGQILVTLPLAEALVEGGTASVNNAESGAGIFLKDGTSNRIVNQGTIRSVEGVDGIAIDVTQANSTQILNSGTITGQILGNGQSKLDNASGGVINAAEIDAGLVLNAGFLDIGPQGAIGTTLVIGDLDQSSLGTIEIDVDPSLGFRPAPIDDRLLIEGSADLEGHIEVDLLSTFQTEEGEQIIPVIIAEDGITFAGQAPTTTPAAAAGAAPQSSGQIIDALSVTQSGVAQYQLYLTSENEVSLGFDIDFANPGILAASNDNQDQVAESFQSLYRAQELDDSTAESLIAIETAEGVAEVFNSLSAEIALDTQIYAVQQSRKFTDSLLSCANNGGVGTIDRFFDSGQCVYVEVEGSLYNRDETSDNLGFRASDFSFSIGGQLAIGEDWNLGGAFRYANSSLTASQASSTSEGNQYFAGVSAKRRFDNIELGAAFGFGYGSFDNKRAPFGASASGEQGLWSISSQLRAAYLYQHEAFYVKPRLGLGIDHFFSSSYSESGSSSFLLDVKTESETYVSFQPAVEVGGEWDLPYEARVRPYFSFGITQYIGDPSVNLNASFLGSTAQPFSSGTDLDGTRYDIAGGIDLFASQSAVLRLEGASSLSKNSTLYGGSLRLEVNF